MAWEAFEDYILYSKHFSKSEMNIISEIIGNSNLNMEELAQKHNLKGRELSEFIAKMNL